MSRDRLAKDGVDGTGFAISDGKSGGKSRRTSACYGQEEKNDENAKEVRGRTEDDLEPRRRRHYDVPTASYLTAPTPAAATPDPYSHHERNTKITHESDRNGCKGRGHAALAASGK